jgi:Ca2+-transporting ATPase
MTSEIKPTIGAAVPPDNAAGLTESEAAARLVRDGPNELHLAAGPPFWRRALGNFTHPMALLLWAGAAIALGAALPQAAIAIVVVNAVNGLFGAWQQYRADQATAALQRLVPARALVRREGRVREVNAATLVVGDVLVLAEGARVCADGRLLSAAALRLDQAALTGESLPVDKLLAHPAPVNATPPSAGASFATAGAPPAEDPTRVFAGTTVLAGQGEALVTATGMATELGTIAGLAAGQADIEGPLQRELTRVTRTVTLLAVGIGAVFFGLAVGLVGVAPATALVFALGMIVAFVPEGMLPTVTLALAMGVQRMAERQAIVKRLTDIETLGCTTVICTDKTGTLTCNAMTVRTIWLPGRTITVTGEGYAPNGALGEEGGAARHDDVLSRALAAMVLCNDARLVSPDDTNADWRILGDPTEGALLVAARKAGVDLEGLRADNPRLAAWPFDHERMRMASAYAHALYVKGAPAAVLDVCSRVARDGHDEPLTAAIAAEVQAANHHFAVDGLRVLALAWRPLPPLAPGHDIDTAGNEGETDLTFLGLVAMADPPRAGVPEAIARCRAAGVRVIMLTGDQEATALGVAQQIGLFTAGSARAIASAELDAMGEAALADALAGEVVFSRVTPAQKLRVVAALQALGHVVAVTGDGVNDAPALRRADIGVAMGRSGTDVAREAAAIVLADDHFASIVYAIEEGRAVYDNIRRFAIYVFASNMAEAVPFAVVLFSHGTVPLALTVMVVLAIDVGTDLVPAIGLGAESPEPDVMARKPRDRASPLLSWGVLLRSLGWYGAIEGVASMAAFFDHAARYGWPVVPFAVVGTPQAWPSHWQPSSSAKWARC